MACRCLIVDTHDRGEWRHKDRCHRPSYPNGLTQTSGDCIALGGQPSCAYAIAILSESGTPTQALVELYVGRTGEGHPQWQVVDEVDVPKIEEGTHLETIGSCRNGLQSDESIIAIVRDGTSEWFQAVNWAYRVDLSGHFVQLDAGAVSCADVGED